MLSTMCERVSFVGPGRFDQLKTGEYGMYMGDTYTILLGTCVIILLDNRMEHCRMFSKSTASTASLVTVDE